VVVHFNRDLKGTPTSGIVISKYKSLVYKAVAIHTRLHILIVENQWLILSFFLILLSYLDTKEVINCKQSTRVLEE